MNRRAQVFFGLATLLALTAFARAKSFPENYRTPDEVSAALRSLASAHPQITKLIPIGKSQGGSEIVVLRIAAQTQGRTDPDLRTAMFVAANIEGLHVIGTEDGWPIYPSAPF